MSEQKPKWMKDRIAPAPAEDPPAAPAPGRRLRGAKPSDSKKVKALKPFTPIQNPPENFAVVPAKLSMWLNATYGICVTSEEAFAKACHDPEYFMTDKTVKTWAQKHGVLNGAELIDVLQWRRAEGFTQDGRRYNDGAPSTVNFRDASTLKSAIALGPVKIGVAADQLDSIIGNENGWFALNLGEDANEDHCVSLCGYGSLAWLAERLGVELPKNVDGSLAGYLMFSWSTIGIIDHLSMVAITGEAYLRTPTTIAIPPDPNPPGPVPAGNVLTITSALAPGSYAIGKPGLQPGDYLETLKQFPSRTPAQWIALLIEILHLLEPVLTDDPRAQADESPGLEKIL
jgi:hypothetical protein